MPTIHLLITRNYGREVAYPACQQSMLITKLTGCSTIRPTDIKTLREMGYAISVTHKEQPSALREALSA